MRSALVGAAVLAVGVAGCSGAPTSASDHGPGSPSATGTEQVPTAVASPELCADHCYADPVDVGSLASDVVVEVSGMAASRRAPGLYYVVGDEAGTSEVAVVDETGALVTLVAVEGMSAENAEALAVGPCPESSDPCLSIGDIGDHVGRADVAVYRIAEPDLGAVTREAAPGQDAASASPEPIQAVADVLRYTYPDAPTDAEALLVDDTGRPLIVSKAGFDDETGATGPTHLYRGDPGGGQLERLAAINLPVPESGLFAGLVGTVVTDASAADGRVLLRTYDDVLEFRAPGVDRGAGGGDLADFPTWALTRVPAPAQVQSETVTYRVDACGYLTTSELTGSIAAVDCRS